MLDNSTFFDGKEAKAINEACKVYNEVSLQIADLEKNKKKACETIKEFCTHGGIFETTKFNIRMDNVGSKETISLKEIKTNAPHIYEELKKLGLVSVAEPYVKMGKITAK